MSLVGQAAGNYRFLPGAGNLPFCAGVVADPGYEIVHATFQRPLPWRDGFGAIERHLAALGRPRTALCAVELRCGKPYTPEEFFSPTGFNGHYGNLLREWGLTADGMGSTARTNIALDLQSPPEQVVFACSYTVPAADAPPTFVVSGIPEAKTVRPGETSPEALREKTLDILTALDERLAGLGVGWDQVTAFGAYTVYDRTPLLQPDILARIGPAALHGVQWFHGRPPVAGSEIELDARGTRQEVRLAPR